MKRSKTTDFVDSYQVRIPHGQTGYWQQCDIDANTATEAVITAVTLLARDCPDIATNPAIMGKLKITAHNERTQVASEFQVRKGAGRKLLIGAK